MKKKPIAVGRPSKYNDKVLDIANAYISGGYKVDGFVIPSAAGLSRILNVNKDTLYEWAKKHKEFSDILANLNAVQEELALNGGLSGLLNSAIVKLLLGKHGYHDQAKIDNISSDGSLSPTRIELVSINKI
jgi:hypothetical protein